MDINKRQIKTSVAMLESLVRQYPDNLTFRLNLGEHHLKLGRKEAAFREMYPVASAYAKEGFIVKAIAIYNMILKSDPAQTEARNALALIVPPSQNATASLPLEPPAVETQEAVAAGEATEVTVTTEVVPPPVPLSSPPSEAILPEKSQSVIPLFESLSPTEFQAFLAQMSEPILFPAGTTIVAEGETGTSLFLITKGRCEVTISMEGVNHALGDLVANDFFGEVAYLTNQPRTANVIAKEETEVLEITSKALSDLIVTHPRIKEILDRFHLDRATKTVSILTEAITGSIPPPDPSPL